MKTIKSLILLLILAGLIAGGVAIYKQWATAGAGPAHETIKSTTPEPAQSADKKTKPGEPPVRVEEKYGVTTESVGG